LENKRQLIEGKLFILITFILLLVYMAVTYIENKIFNIGIIIGLAFISTLILEKMYKKSESVVGKENEVLQETKDNLKTQVETSSKIYEVCEMLNIVSQESLDSTNTIASYIEMADSNTMEQYDMLKYTNYLTSNIDSSLDKVEKDISEKIQFISNSIISAKKGIKTTKNMEKRIGILKGLIANSSKKMLILQEYSCQTTGLMDMMDSILREVNMLSLNASIEASKTGDQGKDFFAVEKRIHKLAKEIKKVSKEIEKVLTGLKQEISNVSNCINEEAEYIDEVCLGIKITSEELKGILDILNQEKEKLKSIKDIINKNSIITKDVTSNINSITNFSEDISLRMAETNCQVLEQNNRAKYLQEVVKKLSEGVYKLQQLVAGDIMERRMFQAVYIIRDYLDEKSYLDEKIIDQMLNKTGMDAIYITNPYGVVIYSSEKGAIGLNLYEVDRTFLQLKENKKEYIITPIKIRVEDGQLFKFLAIKDEEGRLCEVGLGLDRLLEEM